MKLSPSEYNIKKSLEQREITPSKTLWDNIQLEMDEKQSPSKTYFWYKVSSIAAILCLAFLAYQNFNNTQKPIEVVTTDTKPVETVPVQIKTQSLTTPVASIVKDNAKNNTPSNVSKNIINKQKAINNTQAIAAADNQTIPTANQASIDDEVNSLLAQVEQEQNRITKEKELLSEVNTLLTNAINNTSDRDQKEILENYRAELLLAEVEGEIELERPAKLKDRVWEAIVSNFNDIKNGIASN